MPDPESARRPLQIRGIRPVGVLIQLRFDPVESQREDPVESERHVADGGAYGAAAAERGNDVTDGCAERSRTRDELPFHKPERTFPGDGLHRDGVPLVRRERVKALDPVQRNGGAGARLVPVSALHAFERKASRFIAQSCRTLPSGAAWNGCHIDLLREFRLKRLICCTPIIPLLRV